MSYSLSELIDIILTRSELIESRILQEAGYRDLTPKQLECLDLVQQLNNPSLSEIADKLKITRPSVTAMIDKLAIREYVVRVKSDEDRRSAHIHLTAKGEKVTKLHSRVHKRISDLIAEGLSKGEKKELVELLNKSIEHFIEVNK